MVKKVLISLLFVALVVVPFTNVRAIPTGVAVMGDSGSQEYRCNDMRGDENSYVWSEVLQRVRGVDFGTLTTAECQPYNQAWSGETIALNMTGQTDDVLTDFNAGRIGKVIIMLGHNDLYESGGTPNPSALLATYRTNLDRLINAGFVPGNILVVDVSQENWNSPITPLVDEFNLGLRRLAYEKGTAFSSWVSFHTESSCRYSTSNNTYNVGGHVIANSFGDEFHYWRVQDGHLGTMANGLLSNALITDFLGIPRMTDAELLDLVGAQEIPSNPPPNCPPAPTLTPLPDFATATVFTPSTATPTRTPSATFTPTLSPMPTSTGTITATFTPTRTFTPSSTFTPTVSPSPTFTYTPTHTATATRTPSPTFTRTPTRTPSSTFTPTAPPVITFTPTQASKTKAPSFMKSQILSPASQTTQFGTTSGSLSSLSLLQQTGAGDVPAAYLSLQTPNTVYFGYHSFHLPEDTRSDLISTMLLQLNFKGSASASQVWTWSVYNWNSGQWIALGDSIGAKPNEWKTILLHIRQPQRYFSSRGEIRIQVKSNNADGDAKLDYEGIHLTYLSIPATATPTAPVGVPKYPAK